MGDVDSKLPRRGAGFLTRHTPPRVLVAEDDEAMRRIVVETLQKDGYAVSEVPDGGRLLVTIAREYAHKDGEELVDLLVSDVKMPVCTGLQLLEQLRAVHCRIPTILITAFGDAETRRQANALGAVLLDKPFQMDELREAAKRLLFGE